MSVEQPLVEGKTDIPSFLHNAATYTTQTVAIIICIERAIIIILQHSINVKT